MSNTTAVTVSADDVLRCVYALDAVSCHRPADRLNAIGTDTACALRAALPVVAAALAAALHGHITGIAPASTDSDDVTITVAPHAAGILTPARITALMAHLLLEHTGRHFQGYARNLLADLTEELHDNRAGVCPATRPASYL